MPVKLCIFVKVGSRELRNSMLLTQQQQNFLQGARPVYSKRHLRLFLTWLKMGVSGLKRVMCIGHHCYPCMGNCFNLFATRMALSLAEEHSAVGPNVFEAAIVLNQTSDTY